MNDVCHTLTLPVNFNPANETPVPLKLTAAEAPTTGNVLGCEAVMDHLLECIHLFVETEVRKTYRNHASEGCSAIFSDLTKSLQSLFF